MRHKKLVLSLILLILIVGVTGCAPKQDNSELFIEGFSDLLLMPLEGVDLEAEYMGGLNSELMELRNTRSHEMETDITLTDLSSSEDIGFDLAAVEDSRVEISSAYQMDTGDGMIDIYGLGVINATAAIHENMVAIDLPSILLEMGLEQTLYIADFESGLDFTAPIPLVERITDLSTAINGSGMDNEEMAADLEAIIANYKDLLITLIDPEQIEVSTEEIKIAGELQKVQVLSLPLDGQGTVDILTSILEQAKTDEDLYDFIISSQTMNMEMFGMSDTDEAGLHQDYVDAIQNMIDSLPTDPEELSDVTLKVDLLFVYEGFLSKQIQGLPWFQTKKPVAFRFAYSDMENQAEGSYTFITGDDGFDMAINMTGENVDQSFDLNLGYVFDQGDMTLTMAYGDSTEDQVTFDMHTSVENGNHVITGLLNFIADDIEMKVSYDGLIEDLGDAETVNYTISGTIDDGWDVVTFKLTLGSELERVQINTSYENQTRIDLALEIQDVTFNVALDVDSTWDFSDDIEVDLPDFNDPDASHYDSIQEIIEDIFNTSMDY